MTTGITSVNKQEQPSFARKTAGALTGATLGGVLPACVFQDSISRVSPEKMKNLADTISTFIPDVDSFDKIKNYADDAMQKTGLSAKGVKLTVANESNIEAISEKLTNAMKKQPFGKRLADKFTDYFKHGANAAYVPNFKEIIISDKKLYSNVFHEMGHALNHNSSKIGAILQKARKLAPMGVPVVGIALFAAGLLHTNKPEQDGVKKSGWEKTKDFVKNNSGKLAFLTMAPTMVEEVMASVKGLKIAKNYLNPSQLSALKGNFAKAFSTYALVGVGIPLLMGLGNIIAEKIQNKKSA